MPQNRWYTTISTYDGVTGGLGRVTGGFGKGTETICGLLGTLGILAPVPVSVYILVNIQYQTMTSALRRAARDLTT